MSFWYLEYYLETRWTTKKNQRGPPISLRKAPTQQKHSFYGNELGSQWSSYLNQVTNWNDWRPIYGNFHREQGAQCIREMTKTTVEMQILFAISWPRASRRRATTVRSPRNVELCWEALHPTTNSIGFFFFPTISLFRAPPSLDSVYSNQWFCMCPLFTLFCDQASICMSTRLLSSFGGIATVILTSCSNSTAFEWSLQRKTALGPMHIFFCRCCLVAKITRQREDGTMQTVKCWTAPAAFITKPSDSRRPRWLAIWPTHVKAL